MTARVEQAAWEDAAVPEGFARPRRRIGPGGVAVLVWLIATPLAALLVRILDANPLTFRGALLPLAAGCLAIVAIGLVALRWPGDLLAGVAGGGAASWAAFCLWVGYHGTPYGESGLRGDTGRLTAMVTRYTDTWLPVDGFVPSVPTEYPPLFPWLVARLAPLTDQPAWSLVGDGFAVLMSLGILLSFVLWQRITPPWVALLLAVAAPVAFAHPRKTYEIFALGLLVPWALATLARFRRPGGLHWLPAGLVLGVVAQLYQGFLAFSALGLAAMVLLAWRQSGDRAAYLKHVGGVLAVGLAVSAWYVAPFLYGTLALAGPKVNDLYVAGEIRSDPVGVLMFTTGVLGLVKLFGLVGLLVLRRRCWWAPGMLLLLASAYVYRWAYVAVFVATGHTGYLDYTTRLANTILLSAAVLTVWTAAPSLARRVGGQLPRGAAGAGVAVALAVSMATVWGIWLPMPAGLADLSNRSGTVKGNLTAYAHAEPLPDGRLPRYASGDLVPVGWFPTKPVVDTVSAQLGPHARPVTLSYAERLFAFQPWPAFVAVEPQASNTFTRWGEREAEVRRLAALADPDRFARESATTRFGPIDVFVLRAGRDGWSWRDVTFRPSLFEPAHWHVSMLPNRTVVTIRRP